MKSISMIALLGLSSLLLTGCAQIISSGDHQIKGDATIPGHLLITSGRVVLEKGSTISGSVIMTSGDLVANGEIKGNIWLSSGNVFVGPTAIIHGNIKGASGAVIQAEGAQVLGDVSTSFGGFDVAKFFVLAGVAVYFLITRGRRPVIHEKQPIEWVEK
jgi:cytoskeletal protein CcmA (bactofilin family)